MDFNKISEHSILYFVTAIAVFVIAVAVRYLCIIGGCDAGTANLVFVVILGVEAVLYLLLMKTIIHQTDRFIAKRKKNPIGESVTSTENESVHDRIVREKFEQSVTDFCNYTKTVLGKYVTPEELQRLNTYIGLYAREKQLDNPLAIKIQSNKVSNNDLYHYGWNLWNHFRSTLDDQRQECVVAWLKSVFENLAEIEPKTIKGKLKIFDPKSKITLQQSIPDFLRFLKE